MFILAGRLLGLAVPGPVIAQEKPPIKVGIVYPISGVMGTIAIPAYKAHILAMSEINAKGGLLGAESSSGSLEIVWVNLKMKLVIAGKCWFPKKSTSSTPVSEAPLVWLRRR